MASQAESKSKQSNASKEDTSKKSSQSNGNSTKNDSGDLSQKIESLQSALNSDLSQLDSEAALGLVDEWYDFLHKAKEPEVKEIATHLKQLKQLLKGGKATGHEISEVLMEIGEQTSNFAADAEKEVKAPLRQVGKQLSKAGNSVAKAEEHEQIEEIESLTEVLEDGVAEVEKDAATSSIDTWYNLLNKSDDENFKEIASGLKELKQVLKQKNAKPADISSVLSKLGEQTVAAAHDAKRGFKGPIQRLGKLLSKSAKSLEE
jgi:hypothetical protein